MESIHTKIRMKGQGSREFVYDFFYKSGSHTLDRSHEQSTARWKGILLKIMTVKLKSLKFYMYVYVCLSIFLQTPPLPPPSLSLSLSYTPLSPLSLRDTDSDQAVLRPQCYLRCCLLSICSKLEAAEHLLDIGR